MPAVSASGMDQPGELESGSRIDGRSLLFAHQLLGENHPEGKQSDKGSGGGYGYHSGRPPISL